ncbi:radical SAM protein [Mameliella sp. MMSF_3455]|uniref:radical SAM protein n=1 Tax=Mameliella sp. MMSF_3455 TaxID=3046714 RepID=UPI00273DBB68|nr:radical SAM protein [Mameliella sp. MMSF_3455]
MKIVPIGIKSMVSSSEKTMDNIDEALEKINQRVVERGLGLEREISIRSLYFRVSIIGSCNLSCPFCHNEAGPKKGLINEELMQKALHVASNIGYSRVQFTGGEPLIHPKLPDFVGYARSIFSEVGVTTNGTFLEKRILDLCRKSINRIHISLQEEELRKKPTNEWCTPAWLINCLSIADEHNVDIKLNLPVRPSQLTNAKDFVAQKACESLSIQLFSILPTEVDVDDKVFELVELAESENKRRDLVGARGRVFVRSYRPPSGIRCDTCDQNKNCKEQSHSLRFGVDGVLRPCLVSRAWDVSINEALLQEQIVKSSLMAIDYEWPMDAGI